MLDINNNLILIKGEDKTQSVNSVLFDQYGSVQVTFNSGKTYSYKKANVQALKNPKITLLQNRIALRNDIPMSGADMVRFFDEWCRIIYRNGYHELARSSEIRIVESALNNPNSKKCFDYFKQIAIKTGLKVEDHNILASRYEKIGYIRDDSIVSDYLKKEYDNSSEDPVESAIFPFGFNLSQKTAVENALQNRLSVIPAAKILDYVAEHELILSSNRTVSVFRKFVWRFRYGFTNFRFHRHPVENIFTYCQGLYYERRIKEISDRIAAIESDLQSYNFDHKMREYTELSMMAFKAKLAALYAGHSRKRYDNQKLIAALRAVN